MRLLVFFVSLLLCFSVRQASAKTKRTLMTDEQVQQARQNVGQYGWARKSFDSAKKSLDWVLKMSDQELWDFIPPANQPRALNVRFGFDCPIHGKEIFKKGGHYPWIIDREHPFKVKCPVGGEIYPSNDFHPWTVTNGDKLDTNKEYVDDGYGWHDKDGNRYWFVGYYIFWQRWRADILPVIPQLAYVYAISGDTRYSHKAAVMLARIAQEYPEMDYAKQAYHNGVWPAGMGGKILDHDWEGSGTIEPLSIAYDEIYDGIEGDKDLSSFLAGKGIKNCKDLVETSFLQEAAKAIQTGVIEGNMNKQQQLAVVARVLDNTDPAKGYTTGQMIDWIMNGDGEMGTLLYNGVSRDGAASEESIGYTSIWTNAFMDLGARLKPLGVDLLSNPRLKKMVDFYIQTTVADKFSPCIGDANGDMTGGAAPVWSSYMMRKAYDIWGDPMYAKVLNRIGWPSPEISENPETLEAEKLKAKPLGTDLGLKTRDLGGYGLAVLETGEGSNKRAATLYYGSSGAWHGHLDRLNISMWSHGMCLLPEMGYPAHWGTQADLWTRGTPTHYCVEIDENAQALKLEGHLNFLASGDGTQVMDASGDDAYRGIASEYRRTVAMVDVSDTDSYLVDIFRVKGGKTHDYIFHGLPFGEFSTSGLPLGPSQTKGTLMGEDIEFGKTFDGMKTGGYQYLSNVRKAMPNSEWSVNWLLKDKNIGLKMTMPAVSASEVIVTDGVPEAAPGNPDKMEYVLARNDTGSSTFVSLIEPYKGKSSIRRATSLKPDYSFPGEPAAVKIDEVGRTSYVFSALPGSGAITIDSAKIEFCCEFGSIIENGAGLASMMLVNGSILRKGDYSIRTNASSRAKVAAVDYKASVVTLDRAVEAPKALIGQVVVFSNQFHSASFTVRSASVKNGKTLLGFGDVPMVEGIGILKSVDEKAGTVQSSNRFGGYGIKWAGKMLFGRALVNQSLTDSWRVTGYDSGVWQVDAKGPIADKIGATDGKPSRFFYLGEVNVDDSVMLPIVASVRRDGEGYLVRGTVPFEFEDGNRTYGVTATMLSAAQPIRLQ